MNRVSVNTNAIQGKKSRTMINVDVSVKNYMIGVLVKMIICGT